MQSTTIEQPGSEAIEVLNFKNHVRIDQYDEIYDEPVGVKVRREAIPRLIEALQATGASMQRPVFDWEGVHASNCNPPICTRHLATPLNRSSTPPTGR